MSSSAFSRTAPTSRDGGSNTASNNNLNLNSNPYSINVGMTPLATTSYGPNLYERMMIQRQALYRQQQEYQQKILEEKYPVKYVIVHSIIVVLLSITAIVIQILMILDKSIFYYYGTGIWIGVILLITAFVALAITKVRNICLYKTSVWLHLISFFIAGAGLALLNIYAVYWYVSLNYTYNYVLIGVGIIVALALLIFFIVMQYLVNGRCGNNVNRQLYPNSYDTSAF